jgi:hypothetical protein
MQMKDNISNLNKYVIYNIDELNNIKSFIFDNNKFIIHKTDNKFPHNIRIYPYYKDNNNYQDLAFLVPFNYYIDNNNNIYNL